MWAMRLCLFEDHAEYLAPLTLTRPIFRLLCGLASLGCKQLRYWPTSEYGVLVRPHLEELVRLDDATVPINDLQWLGAGMTVLVNGRWLPPEHQGDLPEGPCVGLAGGQVAFAVVGPEQVRNLTLPLLPDFLEDWRTTLPTHPAGGELIRYPWDLVEHNGTQLRRDFAAMQRTQRRPYHPGHIGLIGAAESLWVDLDAQVE